MIEFKHIMIIHETEKVFKIVNKHSKSDIAVIEYFKPWRCWVLSPYDQIVFDIACLEDIVKFMKSIEV